ncbi:MAG: hypothetical protein JXR49_17610 [Acidobacteria bacterium]|nr:hypothetical protein [Acidobacteriota bacterium]
MALKNIEQIVRRFLEDNSNDVLVLKGLWGIGKTYFWQQITKNTCHSIGPKSYAYVSLFGINSLDDLRNAIFASKIESSDIGNKDPLDTLVKNTKSLITTLKLLPTLKDWSAIASASAFHMVKNALICLDDLERKGSGLDMKEILGLVSLLKEQRNCKVALILNDSSLEENDKLLYKRHSEKLIDIELKFSQTPEDAFQCVFSTGDNQYDLLKNSCQKLGITNIRILQRLKRYIERLSAWYTKCEPSVEESILRIIVLFVWSYYEKDNSVPQLEYLRKFGFNPYLSISDEDKNNEKDAWNKLLYDYGYNETNELDFQLMDYVQYGYCDENKLASELDRVNARAKSNIGQEDYFKAWDLYFNSFDNNEAEFVEELIKSFQKNIEYISPMNLSNLAETLRQLKHNADADKLVDKYIGVHSKVPELFDLSINHFRGHIRDGYMIKKFQEAFSKLKQKKTFSEVIKRITSENAWSQEDESFLTSCSTDEYYNLFKKEHSADLRLYVKRCLELENHQNNKVSGQTIAGKTREALEKIANESAINRIRVENIYGIKIK